MNKELKEMFKEFEFNEKPEEMVYEVNHTELSEEEILSDSIYMFSLKNGNIIKL